MKKRGKRALSPVISTVLLIAIVFILAAIIFMWAGSFIQEEVMKNDQPIENSCGDISLGVSLEGDQLTIVNRGNIPVYAIQIKQEEPEKGRTLIGDEQVIDLNAGDSKKETIIVTPYTKTITVIPILLGKVKAKNQKYTCPENYGIEITI